MHFPPSDNLGALPLHLVQVEFIFFAPVFILKIIYPNPNGIVLNGTVKNIALF